MTRKTSTKIGGGWKVAIALAALAACPMTWAQSAGDFGAGVSLGEPTGVTGKYWIDGTRAVDMGIGFGRRDPVFYADFLWHAWNIVTQPAHGKFGFYVGAGPRLAAENQSLFGVRSVVGADYWVENRPIEVFAEAGPVFQVTPGDDVILDAATGVRFYIGGRKG